MKDCPQCDDKAEVKPQDDGYMAYCPFCGFATAVFKTEYDAAEAWNEIWDIIDQRSSMVALALAEEKDATVHRYCMKASLELVGQYLQLGFDQNHDWTYIKSNLYKQIKITELSYDRLKKKIDNFRTLNLDE